MNNRFKKNVVDASKSMESNQLFQSQVKICDLSNTDKIAEDVHKILDICMPSLKVDIKHEYIVSFSDDVILKII